MIDLFLIPAALLIILILLHSWFGFGILQRGVIFTDLSIAQMAALGYAISLGYFEGQYNQVFTLLFALSSALLIAWATTRDIALEAFIGLIYITGAGGILMILAHSAEGLEHFKSLLANDILFVTADQLLQAIVIYGIIGIIVWFFYPKTKGFIRELLFFGALALTVTSSVQLVGVLVVFTLLVAPAIMAHTQQRFKPYYFAVLIGVIITLTASVFAFVFDLPTGFSIASITSVCAIFAVLITSKKKVLL